MVNGAGKEPASIAHELFTAASEHKKLQMKMADVLVSQFVNSSSFAAAKSRANKLEKLKVWDASYSVRIKKAVKDNDQINGSWGVPDQVEKLLKKWA